MLVRWITAFLMMACLTGCASVQSMVEPATIKSIAMSAEPPGQVAVYLTAEVGYEPLDKLMSSDFDIHEDGQIVDSAQSKHTLLRPEVVSSFHTILLLDLSGPAAQPQNRSTLARAAGVFVDGVRRTQPVSVYAFDGHPSPVLLAEFPVVENPPSVGAIPEVVAFQARDDSRDLYSNVIETLKQLNTRLMQETKPVSIGTMVVFT